MRKVGLTLGKFAPLHKGHQHLIETALGEVDALWVIIYDCPDVSPVPLTVRANWFRRLYPAIRVIEAWDGPTQVGDSSEIKRLHEDYIIDRLGIRGISHFYSSEFYGDHMSAALGAVNRLVDRSRTVVPISGTMIRAAPYLHRAYLEPLVYRDLITNVVFLGAPSTGKTTIAERMAEEYQTVWMPEYGREYWERHHIERRLTVEQLVEIAEGHLEREERLLYEANYYLFTDTNALTTYVFSQDYHGMADPRLTTLAVEAISRYDIVFLCDIDIPFCDTWDRSGEGQRDVFQKRIIADLAMRKVPFFVLTGDVAARVQRVKQVLGQHRKYENILRPYSNPMD